MVRALRLTVCGLALLGNLGVFVYGNTLIAQQSGQRGSGVWLTVTALMSMYCIVVLLRRGD